MVRESNEFSIIVILTIQKIKAKMNTTTRKPLDEDARLELRMLLLLEWMMRYDRLDGEKKRIEETIFEQEEQVAALKKGFFRSAEEEDALHDTKNDLHEAQRALDSVEREMDEVKTRRFHLSLSSKDEEQLEPVLREMERQSWVEVGDDDYYITTGKGREIYTKLAEQQNSYVAHFEIFAFVDLDEGVFADPRTDLLEGDRWSDLRVAVAEYRGIDPYRVVFLSMLAEGAWFDNPDWQFDIGMGTLFDDLETLVQNQLSIEELGYEDDQGAVNGEEVIADVIEQGTELARERHRSDVETSGDWPGEELITHSYLN